MDLWMPLTSAMRLPLAVEQETTVGFWIFAYSGLVMAAILVLIALAKKGMRHDGVFKGFLAESAEHLYVFIDELVVSMMGPAGRQFAPFLLALWLFVFTGNVLGLIFSQTPTADWSLNIGMSLVTVAYVQYAGVKKNGGLGHVLHFSGPKMAGPLILFSVLLFFIEIVSELMKIASLSIRLYGNIHGGHILITSLNGLIPVAPILGGFLLPLKFLACVIQAFVWVLLSAVYFSLVTRGHDEHDESHEETASGIHGSQGEPAHA